MKKHIRFWNILFLGTRLAAISEALLIAHINDHVIKVSVMTAPFYWHLHPNSDETFLVMEGSLCIDMEDRIVELFPGQLFTVSKNVKHRTRPNGSRSVNITFEHRDMQTIQLDV